MLIDIHTHRPREGSFEHVLSIVQNVDSLGVHPMDDAPLPSLGGAVSHCTMGEHSFSEGHFSFVGECGIDKLCTVPVEKQVEMFRQHILLSEQYHVPVIIHCVKAQEELLRVRREMHPTQAWIWHGFRGKPQQLEQIIQAGLYVSFGIRYNRESLLRCPSDRMFLETDDAPVTIEQVYAQVSTDLCISMEQLERLIEDNYARIKEVR